MVLASGNTSLDGSLFTGKLESVTFDKCAGVTNRGVRSLARLPRLKELRISGPQITADVAKDFPPGVQVHWFT